MSHIDSIFTLLDELAKNNNKEELNFSMVFEPIQENGNRRSNLTNITFKFQDSIENIKFVSSLKQMEEFPMDIQSYPINFKISNTKAFLLFKNFNNRKLVELTSGNYDNAQLPFPNDTLRDYHQKIFSASNSTNISRPREVQIFKDYIKLPSISFVSEDPFLFLNIFKYLEKDNLEQFDTRFNFNYNWNDLTSSITQSHQLNHRFFDDELIRDKADSNWNVFDGYDCFDKEQFIISVVDSKVVHQAKIINNINYNYTQNIGLNAHHKKLVFLPAVEDKVQDLKLFRSNQYIINSSDHGFIYYSQEKKEYSYSGIYIKDLPTVYHEYSLLLKEHSPGIPEDGINFLFRLSMITLINTLYCIQSKDIKVVQDKIVQELLELSTKVLETLVSKAPEFFENFEMSKMQDLSINVNNSLLRSNLEESELIQQELDTTLSISTSKLIRTHRFFSLISNSYENNQVLSGVSEIDGSTIYTGSFVSLMSYIQKEIEEDEDKHLNMEQLDLRSTFKSTNEHFIFKEKGNNRLETRDLPLELWKIIPYTKKLDLILVDDTPLKAKKIKYVTKNSGSQIIIFKDMVGEFYFRNLELSKYLNNNIKIRWLSEITFSDESLGKTDTVINTSVDCYELKDTDALLKHYHSSQNLSYMTNNINLDLEDFEDISIVSVLMDKNFAIAQTSDKKLNDTRFLSSNNNGVFYNAFSNFIKKIVKEKYGKEVKLVFSTKSIHSKLIRSNAIDFLDIKNASYYGKVEELEKNLAGRYSIDESLVSIYTELTFDMIRRSRLCTGYESEFFHLNLNGTYKDCYNSTLSRILIDLTAKDKVKNYPFVNFFINKGHPILSLAKARPVLSTGNMYNTKTTFGIDIANGKTKHSFIDINNTENRILELLFGSKEFQSFLDGTKEELQSHYGALEDDTMNHRLAHFKMGGSNHDVISYLLNYNYGHLQDKEDYQEYLMTQFNNILITRFKYQLNLKNEVIIELFKLFSDLDKLIIENYKNYYYINTGIKLEGVQEVQEAQEGETQ